MSTVFADGFESGDYSKWTTTIPSYDGTYLAVTTASKHTGVYGSEVSGNITYSVMSEKDLTSNNLSSSYIISGWIKIVTCNLPSNYFDNILGMVRSISDGDPMVLGYSFAFGIKNVSGTKYFGIIDLYSLNFYSSGLVVDNNWHSIILLVAQDASNGSVTLYIDNAHPVTASGFRTNYPVLYAGATSNLGSIGYTRDYYIDGIFVISGTASGGGTYFTLTYDDGIDVVLNSAMAVEIEQTANFGVHDIPLSPTGQIIDAGEWLIGNIILTVTSRLSATDLTNVLNAYTTRATMYINMPNNWILMGWLREPELAYEPQQLRPWLVKLKFDIFSCAFGGTAYTVSAATQVTFVQSYGTLVFNTISKPSISQTTETFIPEFVNQLPSSDTSIWNRSLYDITYECRLTDSFLNTLLILLSNRVITTITDSIYGLTNKTGAIKHVKAEWQPFTTVDATGSGISTPWKTEVEVLVQN